MSLHGRLPGDGACLLGFNNSVQRQRIRARSARTGMNGHDWGWCMLARPIRVHIHVGADQVAGMVQHEVK